MTTDIRTILDFLLADRLRDVCVRRGVVVSGSREAQRDRLLRSLGGDLSALLWMLMRAELVEFLVTRDVGGRYSSVDRASRDDLERLITMLCAGDPRATSASPLGAESPIRFERQPRSSAPASRSQATEKVFRSRVQKQPGFIYYVKDGDVWAAPSRHGGNRRAPQRVHHASVPMDHGTYLYFVDRDGDIVRHRRDGAPLESPPTSVSASASANAQPVRVFISYARTDRVFVKELHAAWGGHESSGDITVSYDDRIDPGEVWEPALNAMMDEAEIAVFLLSNDFLSSTFCNAIEWPRIEARYRRGECEVAPVEIRKGHFDMSPLGRFQSIRPGDRAVHEHPIHDTAWYDVLVALKKVIARARAKRR